MKQGALVAACLLLTTQLSADPRIQVDPGGVPVTGTVGQSYSGRVTASKGVAPYSYTLVSQSLPTGLSLSTDGNITGTPTTVGIFGFTVRATDQEGDSATRSFSITILPGVAPLSITTTSPLPDAAVGTPYSQTFGASGGTPPYRWSGAAPGGLALSSDGLLSGTPATAGTFNFTVTVTDNASRTASSSFRITINPSALTITTNSPLPDGVAGTPYAQTLAASGGTPPYRWSGSAPAGLILSSDGSLTGTPPAAGSFNFTATVTDSASRTASRSFAIHINPAPLTITTNSPLPDATAGTPYSQTLAASGGTPPYRWSGSAPAGLILSSDGSLTGTPAAAGAFNFAATVTDSASRTVSRSFLININPASLTITTSSQLPDATAGIPYAQSLSASGGTPPYRWSGSVPAGFSLSSGGSLTGTPAAAGSLNFTATVTDNASRTATRSFAINVQPPPLAITTASPLPDAAVGSPYSQTFAAAGGTPPYNWSGSPPAGLTISTSGVIAGTPTGPGRFSFNVSVTDNSSAATTRTFSITINPPGLTISSSALSNGSVGVAYSQQISATGGVPPLSWSLAAGQMPVGLTLDGVNGVISGTPASSGVFIFTIQVRDNSGAAVLKQFSITVDEEQPAPASLTISTPAALPEGTAGAGYSQGLTAAGGAPPYVWSISGGSLPAGLTLIPESGLLNGTPSAPGSYSFTALVRDSRGATVSRQFSITIARSLSITTAVLPNPVFGADYQGAITADGGVPPYLWALAGGSLPNGLGLDPVTGVISGSSSGAGPFSFTVQVSDLAGAIFSRQFSLTVAAPAMPTLSLGSVPEATSAAQQVMVDLNLEAGYPIPIAGQVRINFVPDPAIGLDDPAVQFASGGRSVSFTIPANSTRPMSPIAFQTGSVAGTIELQIVPNGAPGLSRSVKVVRSAPIIRNLSVVRNANGFDLRLSGLSPSRELTRATVRWTGTGLDTTEVNVPLDSVANAWYRSTASAQFGSQFSLTLPFTVQGDVNAIQSATLTVSNAEGASSALTVDFTGR